MNQIENIIMLNNKMFHYYSEKKFNFENKKQYNVHDDWIVINRK